MSKQFRYAAIQSVVGPFGAYCKCATAVPLGNFHSTPKRGVSREFLYCLFKHEAFVSVFAHSGVAAMNAQHKLMALLCNVSQRKFNAPSTFHV